MTDPDTDTDPEETGAGAAIGIGIETGRCWHREAEPFTMGGAMRGDTR